MPAKASREEIARLLEAVLGTPVSADRNTSREDVSAWDSVKHIEIIFAVEDAFGVQIPEDTLAELNSVDALVVAVERFREP